MDATTFSLNLIFPIGNVFRALVIGLNVFLVSCRNDEFPPYPGSIYAYGGPILYLCIQVVALFALLMYLDKGVLPTLSHSIAPKDNEKEPTPAGLDIDQETRRVEATESDLLRILHVTRSFGANVAVDDVSLGLGEGEILALLGPNGAGKTTIVNMVRGELRPDTGIIRIRGTDIQGQIRTAQQHLGGT
jgi:ATP-binding cassette subfamily A (ABC1) protein 3